MRPSEQQLYIRRHTGMSWLASTSIRKKALTLLLRPQKRHLSLIFQERKVGYQPLGLSHPGTLVVSTITSIWHQSAFLADSETAS